MPTSKGVQPHETVHSETPSQLSDAEFAEKMATLNERHFKFYCYRCGQRLKVPTSWANMTIPCGRCGNELVIPPPLYDPVDA